MQKIGRKSIVVDTIVFNQSNPKSPFMARVQANKNHGICSIIVGNKIPLEVVDEKTKKKKTVMKFIPTRQASEILSAFQGCQYNDPEVFESLNNALYQSLNSVSYEQKSI